MAVNVVKPGGLPNDMLAEGQGMRKAGGCCSEKSVPHVVLARQRLIPVGWNLP